MQINICLHEIIEIDNGGHKDLENLYKIKYSDFIYILEYLTKLNIPITLYFDDGYASIKDYLLEILSFPVLIKIPIAINLIGMNGYLKYEEIIVIDSFEKIEIVSHGVSHSALTIFDKETDSYKLNTPSGGDYKDVEIFSKRLLSENEVLFQMLESKKSLQTMLKHPINEFVFPYGLYNDDTIRINKDNKIYDYLVTCEYEKNVNSNLVPRYLYLNNKDKEDIISEILQPYVSRLPS